MCREVWENIYIYISNFSTFQIFWDASHLWWLLCPATYLLSHFPLIPACPWQCIHMSLQRLMPAHWHMSVWVTFHCFSASVAGDLPSRRRMVCWLWPWTQQGNEGRESAFFFFFYAFFKFWNHCFCLCIHLSLFMLGLLLRWRFLNHSTVLCLILCFLIWQKYLLFQNCV